MPGPARSAFFSITVDKEGPFQSMVVKQASSRARRFLVVWQMRRGLDRPGWPIVNLGSFHPPRSNDVRTSRFIHTVLFFLKRDVYICYHFSSALQNNRGAISGSTDVRK